MNFNLIQVPENDIDIFLYKIYTTRRKEFNQRLKHDKDLIKQNKMLSQEGE